MIIEKVVTTWRWFYPILAVSLLLRLIVAQSTVIYFHPDETFQYYEQAHRLVFGYGIVPWEYVYGIRSWLIPVFVAAHLKFSDAAGFGEAWFYVPFVQATTCLISLSLPAGMYRLAQTVSGERAAIWALLFGAFWGHFVLYASKPMPGLLAMYALVWAAVLTLRPANICNLFVLGTMLALVLILRYQLAPMVLLLALFSLIRLRLRVWPALLAGAAFIMGAGLLDYWFWGAFLQSFVENFRLNFMLDVASTFGRSSQDYYARELFEETGGLVVVGLLGLGLAVRSIWPILPAIALALAAFHIPDHKEFRFIFWTLPFVFVGVGAFFSVLTQPRFGLMGGVANWLLAAWAAMASISIAEKRIENSRTAENLHSLYFWLSRDPTLTGVEIRSAEVPWWQSPGYYVLHRPVPVYFLGWHELEKDDFDIRRRVHVSHIVTWGSPEGLLDYHLAFEAGQLKVWTAAEQTEALSTRPLIFDLRAPLPGDVLPRFKPDPKLKARPSINMIRVIDD